MISTIQVTVITPFGVPPIVPLAILPMNHWLTSTLGITIGTNGITNGTIGRTLNDIGIILVPLIEYFEDHYRIMEKLNRRHRECHIQIM